LPEKGEMDFVPYNKIDLLYNLVDSALEDKYEGTLANEELRSMVINAREKMVDSLENHLELLQISESGM
jgi:hypothetical protein